MFFSTIKNLLSYLASWSDFSRGTYRLNLLWQTNLSCFLVRPKFTVFQILFRYLFLELSQVSSWKTDYNNYPQSKRLEQLIIFSLKPTPPKGWFIKTIGLKFSMIYMFLMQIRLFLSFFLYPLKTISLAALIGGVYFFISIFYIQVEFTKQLSIWYVIAMLYYLLMSTFNSFLVKYRYGKYTSAIQRFWKRTGIVFWLIEGFLFFLFFYYFLNSSQEPLFMQDYSNLNQEFVVQLKTSYRNLILLSATIYGCFILILSLNYITYAQSILILLLISLEVFYMLYIESYQFVYTVLIFSEDEWVLEDEVEGFFWLLDLDVSNIRVKHQYFILCLVAKYWHFIFIFVSWFFFILKSIESQKINFTLLGYNTQNLVILYILNICCLVQWIKVVFKKFFEITYYWFFIQYDEKFLLSFFREFLNTADSLLMYNKNTPLILNFRLISNSLYAYNSVNLWKYI